MYGLMGYGIKGLSSRFDGGWIDRVQILFARFIACLVLRVGFVGVEHGTILSKSSRLGLIDSLLRVTGV